MSNVSRLPVSNPRLGSGTIHVWKREDDSYEVGHESRSGSSWGYFSCHETAAQAVDAAYQLNRREIGNQAEVWINDDVLADMPPGPDRVWQRGDF